MNWSIPESFLTTKGWQCPVCGYVYSPSWYHCTNCNRPDNEKYTTGTQVTVTNIQDGQNQGLVPEEQRNKCDCKGNCK